MLFQYTSYYSVLNYCVSFDLTEAMIPTGEEVQFPDNQQPQLPEDSKADEKGKADNVASASAGIVVISARDNHGYCFFLSTWQTTNSISQAA